MGKVSRMVTQHALIVVLLLSVLFAVIVGCAPQTTTTPGEEEARAKAVADSIRKVNFRKCQIALSTAFEYFKNKEYDRAIINYRKMVVLDCGEDFEGNLWLYLGNSYREVSKIDSAMWAFNEGLDRMPDDLNLHKNKAYLHAVAGQIDDQIVEQEIIVKLDSIDVENWNKLHEIYFRIQDYQNDKRVLSKIIELDPDNIQAKNDQVTVLQQLGEDPTELLESRHLNNPDNPEYLLEYAGMIYQKGEFEKSVELYTKLIDLDPKHEFGMERLAISYKNLARNTEAIDVLNKLLAIRTNDKSVLYDITDLYIQAGQMKTAYRWAAKTIAAEPKDGRGFYMRALVIEGIANTCMANKDASAPGIYDKLAYELALDDCKIASRMGYAPATERIEFLTLIAPNTEDIFMHASKFKPIGDCYDWLNRTVKRK